MHMFRSFCRLTLAQAFESEIAEKVGINKKSTFILMSEYIGGQTNLGFTRVDVKNYLNSRRQQLMSFAEAECIFCYLEEQLVENLSFFHAHQTDLEEQVINVFWADARMLIDYAYFGQVVLLDTTYCTNHDHRPLIIFSGINHYREGVIFGATLLYDETIETFKWLFKTFLRAHKNVKLLTIFTDQDAVMAWALQEVMPEVKHALCIWHTSRNAMKHLKSLKKDSFHIISDFKHYMCHCWDETKFEEAWQELLLKHDMGENT